MTERSSEPPDVAVPGATAPASSGHTSGSAADAGLHGLGRLLRLRTGAAEAFRASGFITYLVGESISFLGSEVTHLALPLAAVLVLRATPAQMGVLGAAGNLPFLLIGLLAGVWVDRVSRRRMLIGMNLGRAVLLASIPVAAWLGLLRIEQIYVVSFVVGGLSVIAVVAAQAFVPAMVPQEFLMTGNSALEGSASVARIAGPGLAGLLVKWLSAPVAIAVDAVSFLISASCLSALRTRENVRRGAHSAKSAWHDIHEGMSHVVRSPFLRSIALCAGTHNIASNGAIMSLYVLFAVRALHIGPAVLGGILAAGGPGALASAMLATRASRRFGLGRVLIGTQVMTGVARACVPLAAAFPGAAVALLAAGELLLGLARPAFNINQVTLRQSITPDHLQGRMNASIRFLLWAAVPFGALAGGVLAERLGMLVVLAGAAAVTLGAAVFLLASPVRPLWDVPDAVAASRGQPPAER